MRIDEEKEEDKEDKKEKEKDEKEDLVEREEIKYYPVDKEYMVGI